MLIHLRDLIALLSCHLRLAMRARISLGTHPTSRQDPQMQALRCRRRSCLFLWHRSHSDIYVVICIIQKKQTLISFSHQLAPSIPALSSTSFTPSVGSLNIFIQQKYILDIYIIEFSINKDQKVKHQSSSISRRENQQLENKIIIEMVIKEEEVDIMTKNDRQVIIQIIKIIMQEHPGNSGHIMSDNIMSIYFKRCITTSKFVMGINIYTEPYCMQDSFTRELIIQPKIILEKITQVDFDITLPIENCERIQYTCIIDINLVNIIKKEHINHLERDFYIPFEEHIMNYFPNISKYARTSCCSQGPPSSFINELISSEGLRSSHLGAYNLEKVIIKFDILMGIMDFLGHFAQRGHRPPTVIKLDITVEYHIIDFSSISGPNYLSITSVINLDIKVNAERFIKVIYLSYIHQFNIFDIIEAEQFGEHHLLDHISISKPHHTSVIDIKTEQNISDIFAEHHLLDYICISGPNYISVTRAINLNIMTKADRLIRTICPSFIYLYLNQNIDIKTERFIRIFCSSYIYLVKSINREAPSGDHQQILKSHRGASSTNTSEAHIICVQDIMVKQLDIQTSCIYLTILSVFISKYFIFSESIIDNYFHIIFVAVHQWEALDITHSCPSGNGVSRSHHIEWRDIFTNIIDFNPFMHHLIKWDGVNYHITKNTYIMDIIHQESVCIIFNLYIKAVQGYIVIDDIKEAQSSYSLTQSISLIDTIIYDTHIYHTSIYDALGIIMVEGIDLSSMTREYSIIGFIDFMKHPSEDMDIIFDYHILKKKDLNIKVDPSTIHLCGFIITTLNINPTQQLNNIFQSDHNIIDYIIQTNINNIHPPSRHFTDISSQNISMVGIHRLLHHHTPIGHHPV